MGLDCVAGGGGGVGRGVGVGGELDCVRSLLQSGFSESRPRGRIWCAGHLLETAFGIKTCGKEQKLVGQK